MGIDAPPPRFLDGSHGPPVSGKGGRPPGKAGVPTGGTGAGLGGERGRGNIHSTWWRCWWSRPWGGVYALHASPIRARRGAPRGARREARARAKLRGRPAPTPAWGRRTGGSRNGKTMPVTAKKKEKKWASSELASWNFGGGSTPRPAPLTPRPPGGPILRRVRTPRRGRHAAPRWENQIRHVRSREI